MITKYKPFNLIVLALILLGLGACGESPTSTTEENSDDSYTVYMNGGELFAMAAGDSPGKVVVLPSTANAPANYNAVSHANVTFIQQEETSESDGDADSVTITAARDGRFSIPSEVRTGLAGEEGTVDIAVSTPFHGVMQTYTSLPMAEGDSGETAMSLRVIPSDFRILEGEQRVFFALKSTPSGQVVRAHNVEWDCDPDGTGAMSLVEEASNGEYVVCLANTAGPAAVKASINAGGGLSDTANGEIIDGTLLISVSGLITNSSGDPVGGGFLVSFIMNSPNRQRPIHFAGHTDDSGTYHLFLPPTPDTRTHGVLIGTPVPMGARLHKAEPFTFTVYSSDNGNTIMNADFTIGVPLPPLRPRPPIDRIIRTAWHQVMLAARPRFFEPYHGIRLLLSEAVPDGPGQISYPGMFNGWCYNRHGDMIAITPPALPPAAPCPNDIPFLSMEITRTGTDSYVWTRHIKIPGMPGLVKVAEGDINDVVFYGIAPEVTYISDIDSVVRHMVPGPSGPVLHTTVWDWTRTPGSDAGTDDEVPEQVAMNGRTCRGPAVWTGTDPLTACGEGGPLLDYSFTRMRSPEFIDLGSSTALFTFSGESESFFRRHDETMRTITSTICSEAEPCVMNTNGSGIANVLSYDGADNISGVSFDILPFDPDSDAVATGELTFVLRTPEGVIERELIFVFTLMRYGLIQVVRPDGAESVFMAPES